MNDLAESFRARGGTGRALRAILLGLAGLAWATAADAQAEPRKPALGFSIGQISTESAVFGPLYDRAREAIAAANAGDGKGFERFLAPDADVVVQWFDGKDLQRRPFTAETVRAATKACLGPFPFDEAADWVQLSWVCRVDAASPLADIISFKYSPEFSLTIWFEGGRIKMLRAMEPPPIPGRSRLVMDAYEIMKSRH